MPELPEVEITRRGIEPSLVGRRLQDVIVRDARLRYPVPDGLGQALRGQRVSRVSRRGKYILVEMENGCLMIHLGMSGSLRLVRSETPPQKHDHVDIVVEGGDAIRMRDPRRFGAVIWVANPANAHPLLASLGLEPLSEDFTGGWLHEQCVGRRTPIKLVLMDSHVVVGVGNIYASESLFRAAILPQTPAGRLSRSRCERLVQCIRETLNDALAAGGSTLKDFVHSDGASGYFQQQYFAYGREGLECRRCGGRVQRVVMAQRATFFCRGCQRR